MDQQDFSPIFEKKTLINHLSHIIIRFFFCVGFLCFLGYFIISPFRIFGGSMEPNYHSEEYILIEKFSSLFGNTQKRGNVVVIQGSGEQEYFYLKRIIGLPGESILFRNGEVLIQRSRGEEFQKLNEIYITNNSNNITFLPYFIEETIFHIPQDFYWVMGDNRMNSSDSRDCFGKKCLNPSLHFVHKSKIIGNVFLSLGYFDWHKFQWIHRPRLLNTPKTAQYSNF